MPIDTAVKRRSAAGLPFLPLGIGVTPDITKPQEWRQSAAWGYAGILAAEIEVVTGPITGTITLIPRVTGNVDLIPRVTGNITITSRVTGTVEIDRS